MKWYPTPSYLVKRQVILEYLRRLSSREVLEVGCGCGDLLLKLARKGYRGMGIDISDDAIAYAESLLHGENIRVARMAPEELEQQFPIVIASEVLEHHEDDVGFLKELGCHLPVNGYLLLTVPAHMQHWGANDVFCGHFRRYERDELRQKLEASGFQHIEIFSYGVPIYNLMKPMYDRAIGQEQSKESQADKTADSSGMWLLPDAASLFRLLFNDMTMFPFYALQRLFYRSDLGMGYFAAAQKKEPA